MFTLYQTQFCPYCAKVRVAIEALGIDVTIINAPRGSEERTQMVALGGKEQVPFLVDATNPEAVVTMYESDDIVEYLKKKS